VNSLAITGQEQVILTVSTQELKIWTFPSFKQMFEPTTLEDCTEGVTIKVSDSEKYLLLNCGDHSMNIYNLETLELLYRIEDEERCKLSLFDILTLFLCSKNSRFLAHT
jgi:WD40 repeat protein